MKIDDPRIRTLVRRAHRVASSGKRAAAETLYREILEEAPNTAEAWAGLGDVLTNLAEQEAAYGRALAIEPENERAQQGMKRLDDPEPETEAIEDDKLHLHPKALEMAQGAVGEMDTAVSSAATDAPTVCYRHPETETSLRCNRCNRPICIKCAQHTSVGYRCPECLSEIESGYYTAEVRDYFVASLVAAPLSFIAGFLLTFLGNSFDIFGYLLVLFVGGAVGSFIARLSSAAIGRRRGKYIPHLVAGWVVLGALALPLLGLFLLILAGELGGLFILIAPGVYAFIGGSAAFYQLR